MKQTTIKPKRRGFSLLEMAIALGLSGSLLGMVWQMMSAAGTQTEAASLATQASAVARAGQEYLNSNQTAVLAQVPAINDVVRIKITSTDTGNATLTDVQSAGYLPSSFVNQNSYGQSYALYAQRQDAGLAGADASDRLVGLVITTGGNAIADQVGGQIANRLGAAGGFMFSDDNPAAPTAATTIRGTAGGWTLTGLTTAAGWSTATGVNTFGATATAGRLAILTNLLPAGTIGGGGGASTIDALTDAATSYTGDANMFLGDQSGKLIASGGLQNTALGINTLSSLTTGDYNTALGYNALQTTTGSNNVGLGYGAGSGLTTGIGNVALGYNAGSGLIGGSNNVAIGNGAACCFSGSNNVILGAGAASTSTGGSNNILIGSGVNAPVASGSNQLNIGNMVYGDFSSGMLGLGTANPTVSLDVGNRTDAIKVSRGSTAQRPTCNAVNAGSLRWNTSSAMLEYCDGANWYNPIVMAASSGLDGPNAFSFIDVNGAPISASVTSNTITLPNTFTGPQTAFCNGACMAIAKNGVWGVSPYMGFRPGDTIAIRVVTPSTTNTTITASVTLGSTTSGIWSVTTSTTAPCSGSILVGQACPDGTIYAGMSPDTNVPMYTTRCDVGMTWNGSTCTGTRSALSWNNGTSSWTNTGVTSNVTGRANTLVLANLTDVGAAYQPAQVCRNLAENGYSDWYLPAANEQSVLCAGRLNIGGFNTWDSWNNSGGAYPGVYITSTELNASVAQQVKYNDCAIIGGGYPYITKQAKYSVRCVRR